MASITHHPDGRKTFISDAYPDDPLAPLRARPTRTRVLRPRGGFVEVRRIVAPEPWVTLRLVLVVALALIAAAIALMSQ